MTKSQGYWIIGLLFYILGSIKGLSTTEKWMPFLCAALGLYFIIKAVVQNRKEEDSWDKVVDKFNVETQERARRDPD